MVGERRALGVAGRAARVLDVDRVVAVERGLALAQQVESADDAESGEVVPRHVVDVAGSLGADGDHPRQRG